MRSVPEDPAERLLATVVMLAEDQQQAAMERLCTQHPALAGALRARFALFQRFARGPEAPLAAEAPQRFGEYELVRELGRGGMGVVYLARQRRGDQERLVALKLVRDRLWLAPQARERLRREGAAAFRLDHPGICQAYDVGEIDDTPYVAMRYVPGRTLAAIVADARAAGRLPELLNEPTAARPGLPGASSGSPAGGASGGATGSSSSAGSGTCGGRIRALLAVVEQIARALHVAHEAGFVHRDVKPGNVIVMPDGAPVLLDFGLVHDEASAHGLTMTGQPLGTPTYMAPEQIDARGCRVDRTTDVYALGVTLYELLAGEPPFTGLHREELFRRILEQQPRDLRRRVPGMSRDVAVVVETALAKDPARRYATALAFAEDLRRVRLSQPILARPPGLLHRLWLWTQRNRLASAVLALLAVSQVGIVLLAVRAEQRTTEALDANTAAAAALQRAEEDYEEARDAVQQLTEVAQEHLADVPWMEPVRRELFGKVLAFHERVLARPSTTLDERLRAARARLQSAWLLTSLGEVATVRALLAAAEQELASLPQDRPIVVRSCAQARLLEAKLTGTRGSIAATEARYREAIALLQQLRAAGRATPHDLQMTSECLRRLAGLLEDAGGRQPEVLAAIEDAAQVVATGTSAGERIERAAVLRLRGRLRREAGDPAAAVADLQQACASLRDVLRERPHDPTARSVLASAVGSLGYLQAEQQDFAAALASYTESQQLFEGLRAAFPYLQQHRVNLANALGNVAAQLRRMGRESEAPPLLEHALRLVDEVTREDPENAEAQGILGRVAGNLANQLRHQDVERATALYQRAMEAIDRQLAHSPTDRDALDAGGRVGSSLGGILAERRRDDEAMRAFATARRCNEAMLQHHGDQPRVRQNLAQLNYNEGSLACENGDLATAAQRLQEAVAGSEHLVRQRPDTTRYHALLLSHRLRLAWIRELADPASATTDYEAAVAVEPAAPAPVRARLAIDGSVHFDLAAAMRGLAAVRLREGKPELAAPLLERGAAFLNGPEKLSVRVELLLFARDRLDLALRTRDGAAAAAAATELLRRCAAVEPDLAASRLQSRRVAAALPAIELLLANAQRQADVPAVRRLADHLAH